MRVNKSILFWGVILALFGFLFAIYVPGKGSSNYVSTALSIASLIYSILIGFFISSAKDKLTKINEALKEHEGNLLFTYQLMDAFGEHAKNEVRNLIDTYLMDQLDYYLNDFKYSNKSFMKYFKYLVNLKPQNSIEEMTYSSMQSSLADTTKQRKIVESLVNEKLSFLEWFSIYSLLGFIIFTIFYFNTGNTASVIATVIISLSAISLTYVLYQIDNLSWKEDSWIWEPILILFKELDLIPYLPDGVVQKHRAKLTIGEKIRIAHYKNVYPDMTDKTVETIEIEHTT